MDYNHLGLYNKYNILSNVKSTIIYIRKKVGLTLQHQQYSPAVYVSMISFLLSMFQDSRRKGPAPVSLVG